MLKKLNNSNKAIILLSGGADSATTLYFAKKNGYKLHALIFDYGQRHKNEIASAKQIARINNIDYTLQRINLSWAKSSLTNKRIKVTKRRNLSSKKIPLTYVSGRNIIFLSYAVSLAESIGAKKIFLGAHIQDYSGYPDCRPEFIKSFQKTVNFGLKEKGLSIQTPLIRKNKKQIIKMGLKLGVPFENTYSCYQGKKKPCCACDSCRFRIAAFTQLGLTDPLLLKSQN